MAYTHLSKLYYKNEAEWQAAYDQRFRSFGTRHFGVELQQYQRPQCHEAFLCTCDDLVLLVQEIYTLMGKLLLLKNSMPQEHLLTSKVVKPYRYKLNLLALQRSIDAAKK